MESFARLVRDLSDTISWFVRAREIRVFHARTTADLRTTALRLIASGELHADNRSPWVVLEDPATAGDADNGWASRLERLRALHDARRARMAEEGEALPELPERPAAGGPLAAFGAQLAQILSARASWHEGLVVVLAPTRVDRPAALLDDLRTLVQSPSLAAVRWIIVDPDPAPLAPIASRPGVGRFLLFDARVDEAEAARDLDRMLDAASMAPPDISGPARVGAAWPAGVSPPPRRDRPPADPATVEALLRQEGISLPLAGARGTELARAVMRGAQAMRRGEASAAVDLQTRARDLCVEAGLGRRRP
jgi:hypothetical protein